MSFPKLNSQELQIQILPHSAPYFLVIAQENFHHHSWLVWLCRQTSAR